MDPSIFEFQTMSPHAMVTSRGWDRFRIRPWGRFGGSAGPLGMTHLIARDGVARGIRKIETLKLEASTLTARAENHIRGNPDIDDTIARLRAFEEAGADVLYAPGLRSAEEIRSVCDAVSKPVNVLALRNGLTFAEIVKAGAQRVSVGGGSRR